MRKVVLGIAALAIVAIGCAPKTTTTSAAGSGSAQSCSVDSLPLYAPGKMTIATGNPAYKPWYGGDSVPGSDWKSGAYTGDPHTCDGYESAFAYALAPYVRDASGPLCATPPRPMYGSCGRSQTV